jgi:predicted MFS family arabinose efflux permease
VRAFGGEQLGALADRRSPRGVLVLITAVRACAMAGYLLAGNAWTFTAVTVAFVALANGGSAVRTALVAGLVSDNGGRVKALAQQRAAQHVGYAAAAGIGATVHVPSAAATPPAGCWSRPSSSPRPCRSRRSPVGHCAPG